MEWTSDLQAGDAVLSAGRRRTSTARSSGRTTVPASGDRSLVFDTKYNIELDWDFGIVQISTDGGLRWTSIDNATTTTQHNGGAIGSIVSQLPGFSGAADWSTQTFDLSAYAGRPCCCGSAR